MKYNIVCIVVICMCMMSCDPSSINNSEKKYNEKMPAAILKNNPNKNRTVEQVVNACEKVSTARFEKVLTENKLTFPPKNLQLLAFKEDRKLEVYSNKKLLHTYNFTAYSGKRGPKEKEGDRQIPEGMYGIEYLNPNSRFHISLKINYPNTRDLARAAKSGITNPGTDIFIHGKKVSIGCIPIGDAYIEELFTLVALTGIEHVRVLIFPNDARKNGKFLPCEVCPADTEELYTELKKELMLY